MEEGSNVVAVAAFQTMIRHVGLDLFLIVVVGFGKTECLMGLGFAWKLAPAGLVLRRNSTAEP